MVEKRVKVSFYGRHAAALVPVTREQVYLRKKDHTRFIFELQGDNEELVDIALALVDASGDEMEDSELLADLQLVRQSNSRMAYLMLQNAPPSIGDGSEHYLRYLLRRARLSAHSDLDYLPADVDIDSSGGLIHLLEALANLAYPMPEHSVWMETWMRIQNEVLDLFARCLSLPCTQSLPDVRDELLTIKDDDHVWELTDSTLSQNWEHDIKTSLPEDIRDASSYFPAHRISHSLIAKSPTNSERASMEFVRQYTTIPVPRTHLPNLGWLIMDRIDGETLLSCWGKLSWFRQLRVACTLRLYVKQLRALKRSYPGNIVDGRVGGLLFQHDVSTQGFGPYDSTDALRRFCMYAAHMGWPRRARSDEDKLEPFPDPDFEWSSVFIHGDLNMTNIMLDRIGTVWLIDWAMAGYYPACLESLAMQQSNELALRDIIPASWARYRSFIAGSTTPRTESFWYTVLGSVYRFH
ncbi:hypothetical protein PENSPDRAFT_688835 [Peniophora sp. CONT]|nr:hypothetical protein PENSPDRAFT_688835 [Peniophora sp. CONT]